MDQQLVVKQLRDQTGYVSIMIFLEKVLGKGGFGTCYLGYNFQTSEIVAVKSINRKNKKKQTQQLFERQIDTLSELTYSSSKNSIYTTKDKIFNLVSIYPYKIISDNHYYVVMEYCSSGDLYKLMAYRRQTQWFNFGQFLQIMKDLIEGCTVMRSKKIIHDDIKPQNIFINDGVFKFGDFGLAFKLNSSQQVARGGTLGYYPLFQKKKNSKQIYSSDIYSLGIIFYQLFYGCHPYGFHMVNSKPRQAEEVQQNQPKIKKNKSYGLGIYQGIKQIISQMIKKNQPERIDLQKIRVKMNQMMLFNDIQRPLKITVNPIPKKFKIYISQISQINANRVQIDSILQQQQIPQQIQKKISKIEQQLSQTNIKCVTIGNISFQLELYLQNNKDQFIQKINYLIFEYLGSQVSKIIQQTEIKLSKFNQKQKNYFYQSINNSLLNILNNNRSYIIKNNKQSKKKQINDIQKQLQITIDKYLKSIKVITQQNSYIIKGIMLSIDILKNLQNCQKNKQQIKKIIKHQIQPIFVANIFEKKGIPLPLILISEDEVKNN